jgi:ATP-dependent protease Clp ATPase subunit
MPLLAVSRLRLGELRPLKFVDKLFHSNSLSVLKQHLDRYVVGQDRSKRILSTAIYHHYQRVHQLRKRELEQQEQLLQESQAFPPDAFEG